MRYADIERRMKRLEARTPKQHFAGRHIVVDLAADMLSGQLTEAERRRRIDEARRQARPDDMLIVINCRPREGDQ